MNLGVLTLLGTLVLTTAELCLKSKCVYRLELGKQTTMSYLSTDGSPTLMVKLNDSRLQLTGNGFYPNTREVGDFVDPNDVITTDGYVRDVITINGQFPGPTIEVLEGAEVEILVVNSLFTEAASIHFHGLNQRGTLWMDGVPGITQHAILPGHSFEHRFKAEPAGTHWYHSHFYNQRLDGLFGMFIVHEALPTLPYFVLSVVDWYHVTADHLKTTSPYTNRGPAQGYIARERQLTSQDGIPMSNLDYVSGLINGRGRYNDQKFPLSDFKVVAGEKNVLKMCHAGAEFPWEISVDDHRLVVSSMGGDQISPEETDFLVIYPGECYDVIFVAGQGSFWLRAKVIQDPRVHSVPEVRAIIHGEDGLQQVPDPVSKERKCSSSSLCVVFNCPFKGYADEFHRRCITIDQVHPLSSFIPEETTRQPVVHFLNFGFQVGSSVNAHQWVNPAQPMFCNNPLQYTQCPTNCSSAGCICPYTITLSGEEPALMVLSSVVYSSAENPGHHTVHLHGHLFEVLQAGYPQYNHTTGHWISANPDVQCRDTLCADPYWADGQMPDFHNRVGPVKDTVLVPAYGYVIIRLRKLHPGFWLMHCHQELHLDEGMLLQFHVKGHIPPVPDHNVYEWVCSESHESKTTGIEILSRDTITSSSSSSSSIPVTSLVIIITFVVLALLVITIITVVISIWKKRPFSSTEYQSISTEEEVENSSTDELIASLN